MGAENGRRERKKNEKTRKKMDKREGGRWIRPDSSPRGRVRPMARKIHGDLH